MEKNYVAAFFVFTLKVNGCDILAIFNSTVAHLICTFFFKFFNQ
jgi:hypothetical protein